MTDQATQPLRVVLGADHRGLETAKAIAETLTELGYSARIVEHCSDGPCDYPEQAWLVGREITSGNADRGILICGTGIGMSIAANKIHGLRAALVHDELTARLSRSHNDANVLCLSADLLGERAMEKIVEVFLRDDFEGGRHARRIAKIRAIEAGAEPSSVTE